MQNKDPFLRAIIDQPADDELRIAYADWLQLHGDPRGAFLRVQQALNQGSKSSPAYRDLCEQEQELVRKLDPTWMQLVRRYTTAAPCRDLAALVPELRGFAQTTTRLHPHRAVGPLPVWLSKIGGRFLWPSSEPWPSCPKCNVNLAPILQMRSRDVPDVTFPAGTDLLQLFWCPDEAAHDYQPAPRIFWRTASAVNSPRVDDPNFSDFPRTSDWEGYIPFECMVYPERVIEYPLGDDLRYLAGAQRAAQITRLLEQMEVPHINDLADRFHSEYGPSDAHSLAFYELGQCPGTKVGGKPRFARNGRQFDHLVTLSTWECDSASFRRWVAVEDQRLLAPLGMPLTWSRLVQESKFRPLQEVLGMQLGRTQRAHIYLCREGDTCEVIAFVND